MNTIQLNTLQNVKSSIIQSSISIEDYINQIKNGFELNKLAMARAIGKGDNTYTSIKENRKAVLFNFNFLNRRRNKNIVNSTGLLFFDIDNSSFDLNSINKDDFYIIHKSFGGKGYTLIARVEDITYDNHNSFKQNYMSIASQLGIDKYIDESAIKMTQPTILGYDKDIIVNDDSKVFKPISKEIKKGATLSSKKGEGNIGSVALFYNNNKVKYETTLDDYSDNCVYIEEGKEFVECKLPFKKDGTARKMNEGERRKWISIFCNNLLYINGYVKREQLFSILNGINQKYCIKKLSEGQLYSIIDYKLQVLKEGNLEAFKPRLKKFWTQPSIKQKRDVYDAKRRSLTDDKLEDFFGDEILNINKKITQKVIAEYTGLSLRTIKNRFKQNPEYKQIVKDVNKKLKG